MSATSATTAHTPGGVSFAEASGYRTPTTAENARSKKKTCAFSSLPPPRSAPARRPILPGQLSVTCPPAAFVQLKATLFVAMSRWVGVLSVHTRIRAVGCAERRLPEDHQPGLCEDGLVLRAEEVWLQEIAERMVADGLLHPWSQPRAASGACLSVLLPLLRLACSLLASQSVSHSGLHLRMAARF